jgi:hypothetical protein
MRLLRGIDPSCILVRMSGECLQAQPVDANEGVKRGLLAGSTPQLCGERHRLTARIAMLFGR